MKKNRRLLMLLFLMFFLGHNMAYSQLVCNNNVFVSLGGDGSAKIYAESIVENTQDIPDLQVSLDNVVFGDFVTFNCDDLGEQIVYAKGTVDGQIQNCFSTLTIEDKLFPFAIAQNVTVSLNGGNSVTIEASDVDAGSGDNCSIEMSLSQYTFTANGSYDVELTVTDPFGNSTSAFAVVTVIGGQPVCNNFMNISLDVTGQAVVPGSIFLEGNSTYDVLEVSLDNVNFDESVTFTCDDIGESNTVYVRVEIDGNEFNCTSEAMIEDKLGPVLVVEQNFIINLASETDTYTLQIDDINEGSWDNCTDITFELSQTEFSIVDWGDNLVMLKGTDSSGNFNTGYTYVTVLVDGQSNPMECISLSTAEADLWSGDIELWGVDFVSNYEDFDFVFASLDPAGPYTESFIVDCEVSVTGPITVYIKGVSGISEFYCSSLLTVVDNNPPVAVAEQNITLLLVNGSATLSAEEVDNGSYDACTEVELSIDKTMFTTADLGYNKVWLTVTDMNGNINMTWSDVIVTDGTGGCNLYNVIFPDYIEIYDENGTSDNLTIENLQSIYGYAFEEVHPYTIDECDGIAYSHSDTEIIGTGVIKRVRTWTVLDWYAVETATHTQLLKLFTSFNNSLVCNDNISVTVENGGVTLYPQDVLEGGPYDYDNMSLNLVDSNGNEVVDNFITNDYVGQTLTYTVTDDVTGNACWGTVNVDNGLNGCPLDDEDVSYPLPTIQLTDFNLDPSVLSPDYLVDNYDFLESEVLITWSGEPCVIVGYTYEDDVFDYGDGSYKIIRTLTLVDWITYDPSGQSSGIWTFTQVINTGVDPASLICDVLPRTADVGDCDSGHTLDDDVEWPADLTITDYRITPEELIEYSMVDILDSEPSFYNNPLDYQATYTDLLVDLTTSAVVIGRVWTVDHAWYGFTWTYNQTITVDFTDFENLVTVNTGTNRAMPGVMINSDFTTNMEGSAFVEGGPVNSVLYEEDDYLNGLNVLDFVLMQRHIVGLEDLDENGILAADVNLDNEVSTTDLVEFKKRILALNEDYNWSFYNKIIDSPIMVEPKGAYTAIKSGDVDDTALLIGDDPLVVDDNFKVNDILLNNGESYTIPVYLETSYSVYGIELRASIDSEIMKVIDITSANSYDNFDYEISEDGILTILLANYEDEVQIGGDLTTPFVNISFEAKANSLLSLGMDLESHFSYLATSNLELIVLGGELGGMINTGTNSEELSSLSVYPNPTSDYLNIDLKNVDVDGDLDVTIFELNGQKIFTRQNTESIDVSDLKAGMYYYQIKMNTYTTTGKFMVIK